MATPRAPFDQGLFLAHFNKGKDLFETKHYEQSERQLEEAYLLRPRDPKVLNLLGLVYFKQEKYEKAEEIYRKLTADSPDAYTLHYNLGLIYFKLQRLDEAELAFSKALELTGINPKINFYLGSIYERMKRYQDAIYQYRHAGANILVRRIEDRLAGREKRSAPVTAPPLSEAPTTPTAVPARFTPAAPNPSGDAFPTSPAPAPRATDTAEFQQDALREAVRREHERRSAIAEEAPAMASAAPPAQNDLSTETARLRVSDFAPALERAPEVITFPQRVAERPPARPTDRTLPPTRPPEIFRFLDNNLMEADVSGKVFIKQGTVYSYGGNLTFWVKERRPGGHPPLVMITGTGKLILTDQHHEITLMHIQDETVHVGPAHFLACEATLTPRYVSVGDIEGAAEFIALDGAGMLALSVATKPLPLVVSPELPVSVPAASIITWSGMIVPHAVENRQVYEVMAAGRNPAGLIRLEGSGRLLVEQGLS